MFTNNDAIPGLIQIPNTIEIKKETIQHILNDAGIKSSIVDIGKPHAWVMQSQKIHLEDGCCLLLKIGINPEWTDASSILNQVAVSDMIRSTGIKQPDILAYSADNDDYGFRFILSECQRGERLCDAYKKASKIERERLYGAVGQAYSHIHDISNNWSGVWNGCPDKNKYPIHPSEFYSQAEFHTGSAKYLLENGIIDNNIYGQLCSIWDESISYLKQRPSSLTHVSPFPWSIYVKQNEKGYSVEGFAALGDFMWWDSMADIAHLLYPPFLTITEEERSAFILKYNKPLDEHAINLYMLLNRICAMSGCYLAPVEREYSKAWIKQEINSLRAILNERCN